MRVALITELDAEGYQLKEEYEKKYDFALDLYNEMEDYLSVSDECRKVIVKDKETGKDIFRLKVNPESGEVEEIIEKEKKPWKPRAGFGGRQKNAGRPKGSLNKNRKGLDKTITIPVTVEMWRYLKRMSGHTGEFIRSAIQEKHDRLAEARKKYDGRYDLAAYRQKNKLKKSLEK